MANEAQVRATLQVITGNHNHQTHGGEFNVNMATPVGPTPGAVLINTTGEDINFTELTTPGWVWMKNLDSANYVEWGLHDGSVFHPVGILRPGKCALFEFSPNLGEEHTIAGTGTTGTVNVLHLRANTATCQILINAWETGGE